MDSSLNAENPLSLVSKTLSEKMKYVQNFEDLNLTSPELPSDSKRSFHVPRQNDQPESQTIGKKYADFLLASTSSQEQLSYRSEKSELFIFLKKFEDSHKKDHMSLGSLEVFLREIGLLGEGSLPKDLLENFMGVLTLNSSEQSPVMNINLVFQVFQLLLQDKVQVNRISSLIHGILENHQKNQGITEDFNIMREEKGLWSLEKLIVEFRKLLSQAENKRPQTSRESNPQKDSHDESNGGELGGENYLGEKGIETLKKDKKYYKDRYEMLFEHAKYLKEKQEMTHAVKYMQDLQQYSFKPQITEFKKGPPEIVPKPLSQKQPRQHMKSQEKTTEKPSQDPIKTIKKEKQDVWIDGCFDRLYVNSKLKQERSEKYKEIHEKTQKDTPQCTFKPSINKNQYSSNPGKDLAVKGFEETVKRMSEARKEKEKVQRLYEEPLLKFPQNKKYIEQRETNYTVPEPFEFKPGGREGEILMFVDVEVAGGKIGRIGIHKGDDVDELARNFAKIYTLNKEKERKLAGNLNAQIENYYRNLNNN